MNIILVCKKYQHVLDRIRMNPIQITSKTKNLFKFIQTQQFFSPFDIKLNTEKFFFNFPKCVKECLLELNNFNVCPLSVYTQEDQIYLNGNIPDFVRNIGEQSFAHLKITSLAFLPSVIEISNFAFSDCYYLSSIKLPSKLTRLGSYAFNNCSVLKAIELPKLLEWVYIVVYY
ncbi:hypothetical protein EIN_523310 [Entamoeba invadens IP1]|uniref:Leucine rich repeat containing protein BspA family protein n=1 Tax=Entamoeba invadens IP1 TaxID=370355 RepID=A0A0A1UG91_ENTIV|nr:hypothetical protein EIN_523310 [Entamoeba invadens IP1]ELP92453.1 hypothetical protein EIN_523310 [Entamoeba invadens IP1]|eukprot:XP_004259224.1 hypothetical protein EIN_523310 [Entamoeba invadens IP1]